MAETKHKTKKSKKTKSRSKIRASWKGQLRFGLVSLEVEAVNAEIKEKGEIHFHLLHEPDHQRIHYAKICPTHGEVPNREIVEGYEYGKGRYVEFDKDELDALRTDRERAFTIDTFIEPTQIDPIYFDGRMYYLLPFGTSASEPYVVLQEAMAKQERWGIGQIVFSGREQLAIVRPLEGMLTMALLNYPQEIRRPTEFAAEFVRPRTTPRKIKLAEDLIRDWSQNGFGLDEYTDKYHEKVAQLVQAKIEGREVVAPAEPEEPQVVNLMDALKRSVAQIRGQPKAKHARHGKTRTHHPAHRRRA